MRQEVAIRIANNKNLCTRKKRIYKHRNGITRGESPSTRLIKQSAYVRDRENQGALKKEIWVLVRAPLFWVVVWSRQLFFIQKK